MASGGIAGWLCSDVITRLLSGPKKKLNFDYIVNYGIVIIVVFHPLGADYMRQDDQANRVGLLWRDKL